MAEARRLANKDITPRDTLTVPTVWDCARDAIHHNDGATRGLSGINARIFRGKVMTTEWIHRKNIAAIGLSPAFKIARRFRHGASMTRTRGGFRRVRNHGLSTGYSFSWCGAPAFRTVLSERPIEAKDEYTHPPAADLRQDGNSTGWSGNTANYSVSTGVLKNTLDTTVRDLYLSETDADHDLSFDYVRCSSTGRMDVYLRTIDGNNRLYLEINPGDIKLRQVDGGTLSTLATYTATVTEDAWYKLRAILDGTSVKIYWGAQGADFNEIISATTTKTTTVRAAYFRAQANSEHGFDNIQLIAGTRSTTKTFTYNDANEQLTHAKNGVTTTMTYDDWGRLEERDDGTHTATYAYRYGSKLYSVTSNFPGEGNVTYKTGGDGNRRSCDDGASFTWYNWEKGRVVQEEGQGAGLGDGPLLKTHMKGQAEILGSSPASGTYSYLSLDHLGSTRGAYNASKVGLGVAEFTPFGFKYNYTLPSGMDSIYAGHQYDENANLYYAHLRSYSPAMSRWLGRDPKGMADGPNVYVYTGDNPVNRVDLDGGAWTTLSFLWHYNFGGGSSVNLKDIGLLVKYKSSYFGFILLQKAELSEKARSKAQAMKYQCLYNPRAKLSGTVSNTGRTTFNFEFGNPLTNPLWSLGNNQLRQNGRCTVILDCSTRQYTFTCNSNFNMNDAFRDPYELEDIVGIPVDPGKPYDIYAYWTDTWTSSGQVSPIITVR